MPSADRPVPAGGAVPNLEQLRKQAKDLRQAVAAGSVEAAGRLAAHLPRLRGRDPAAVLAAAVALRDCQHVVACEHGCASWRDLLDRVRRAQPQPAPARSLVVDRVDYADADLVPVEIVHVELRDAPANQAGVVVLAAGADVGVSITCGRAESGALTRCLEGEPMPRPLTHELLAACLQHLGARVTGLVVHHLSDAGIYYGHLRLATAAGDAVIDARPSDGLVLAVMEEAPIYVSGQVLASAGQPLAEALSRFPATVAGPATP